MAVLWQADPDPLASQIARAATLDELGAPAGPRLVAWPRATGVERSHLLCALAEDEILEEELAQRFSRELLQTELAALRDEGRLVVRAHRLLDARQGTVRTGRGLRLAAGHGVHDQGELSVCAAPWHLVERATGAVVATLEGDRARAAAYPRRVLIADGRRLAVLDAEAQDRLRDGCILCEPTDERVMTTPIRVLDIDFVERRSEAPADAPGEAGSSPGTERRKGGMRSLGGAPFTLQYRDADIGERVLGLRRFDLSGGARDSTLYDEPVQCRYRSRVAVLGFPAGEPTAEALHALVHGFRICLPALLCYGEDDLELVALTGQDGAAGAIAFVDLHPGGAGFADAVGLDTIGALMRLALALMRECPEGCATGCPECLHTWTCRAPAEQHQQVDKAEAANLLAALLSVA